MGRKVFADGEGITINPTTNVLFKANKAESKLIKQHEKSTKNKVREPFSGIRRCSR